MDNCSINLNICQLYKNSNKESMSDSWFVADNGIDTMYVKPHYKY